MQTPERPLRSPRLAQARGWTLTELLIGLALMGSLAALALPAYLQQQRQARRSDGQAALQQLQMDQARWRSLNDRYADSVSALGWGSDLSPRGHYRIRIVQADADGYTVEAQALAAQAGDSDCSPLRLRWLASASVTLSAGDSTDSDPQQCWRR